MSEFKTQIVTAQIRKDMSTTITKECYLHECEVLEEVHDEGEVTISRYGKVVVLDVEEEVARLNNIYGGNADSGINYVETVFGRHGRDIVRTEDRIKEEHNVKKKKEEKPLPKDLNELTIKSMKKELDKRGVAYNKNGDKSHYFKLLDESINPKVIEIPPLPEDLETLSIMELKRHLMARKIHHNPEGTAMYYVELLKNFKAE